MFAGLWLGVSSKYGVSGVVGTGPGWQPTGQGCRNIWATSDFEKAAARALENAGAALFKFKIECDFIK